jgi:hypothetical protein
MTPMLTAASSAAMLIRISENAFLADLCAHFFRAGFTVEEAGGTMVRVTRDDAPDADQERREVELHLAVWRVRNPDVVVELVRSEG